jgi:nicotinamide riboside transporter PnuC
MNSIISNLSLLATVSVLLANILIVRRVRLALSLFIVCNICYVIMMTLAKNYILAGQNVMLICIGSINLYKTKSKEMR